MAAGGRARWRRMEPYGHRQQRATGWRPEAVPVGDGWSLTGIDSNARPDGGRRPCPLATDGALRASTATRDRMAAGGRARWRRMEPYGHRQQRATERRPKAVPVGDGWSLTGIDSNARPKGGRRPCPLATDGALRASTATRDRMAAEGRARWRRMEPYGHRQQRATGWRPKAVPVGDGWSLTGIDSNARPDGGRRPCPLATDGALRASTATRDRMAAGGRAPFFTDRARTASRRRHAV